MSISYQQRIYFRDLLREARAKALSNAENFEDLVFVLEKFGSFLFKGIADLGKYQSLVYKFARKSSLAECIPKKFPDFHTDFESLYELLKDGRNSAMHEGVFARNLTQHAVEISIVLENALMISEKKIKDFMVRNPVCAFDWQPISFIRQNMLFNSFSYLPIYKDEKWMLISDLLIAAYLRKSSSKADLKRRMSKKFKDSGIQAVEAKTIYANDEITKVTDDWNGSPICVTLANADAQIVGILTPFDLL